MSAMPDLSWCRSRSPTRRVDSQASVDEYSGPIGRSQDSYTPLHELCPTTAVSGLFSYEEMES